MDLVGTLLRVGALVVVVGQGCREPVTPIDTSSPSLDIPPLDAGVEAAARSSEGVRFAHPVPRAGAVLRIVVKATSRSEDASGVPQISIYDSHLRVEILAVEGPAPSQARLQFLRSTQSYQGNPTPTVVEGKEYVVDVRAPHVRDLAGAPVAAAETQHVLDVFPDLGTRTRVDQVLPSEPMKIGERRDELASAVLRILHPRAWTLQAGTATLTGVDGAHAVFEVSLEASNASGLLMKVTGEARVGLADAELAALTLEGGYETKKDAGPPEPPGSFSYVRQVTSEPARRTGR